MFLFLNKMSLCFIALFALVLHTYVFTLNCINLMFLFCLQLSNIQFKISEKCLALLAIEP